MRRLALVVLVGTAACTSGCARKKTPAATRPTAAAARPTATRTTPAAHPHEPMTGPLQPNVVRRLVPISEQETQGLLLAPAGARVLEAPAHAQVGERIEGSWCYDAGELAALGAGLAQQYGAAGWQEFAWRPNPNLPDRGTVSAHKDSYALFGSLQHSDHPGCRAADGKTFVSLGVHRLEVIAPVGAPDPRSGVGARGTTGLRTP